MGGVAGRARGRMECRRCRLLARVGERRAAPAQGVVVSDTRCLEIVEFNDGDAVIIDNSINVIVNVVIVIVIVFVRCCLFCQRQRFQLVFVAFQEKSCRVEFVEFAEQGDDAFVDDATIADAAHWACRVERNRRRRRLRGDEQRRCAAGASWRIVFIVGVVVGVVVIIIFVVVVCSGTARLHNMFSCRPRLSSSVVGACATKSQQTLHANLIVSSHLSCSVILNDFNDKPLISLHLTCVERRRPQRRRRLSDAPQRRNDDAVAAAQQRLQDREVFACPALFALFALTLSFVSLVQQCFAVAVDRRSFDVARALRELRLCVGERRERK